MSWSYELSNMGSDCVICQKRAETKRGFYDALCVQCVADLIRSARPIRRQQDALIAAVKRIHPLGGWKSFFDEVLEILKGASHEPEKRKGNRVESGCHQQDDD